MFMLSEKLRVESVKYMIKFVNNVIHFFLGKEWGAWYSYDIIENGVVALQFSLVVIGF